MHVYRARDNNGTYCLYIIFILVGNAADKKNTDINWITMYVIQKGGKIRELGYMVCLLNCTLQPGSHHFLNNGNTISVSCKCTVAAGTTPVLFGTLDPKSGAVL